MTAKSNVKLYSYRFNSYEDPQYTDYKKYSFYCLQESRWNGGELEGTEMIADLWTVKETFENKKGTFHLFLIMMV